MDYDVRLIDLPVRVRSFVRKEDDHYTIVLNSRLSMEAQQKCFWHELRHLSGMDFCMPLADAVEYEAHR